MKVQVFDGWEEPTAKIDLLPSVRTLAASSEPNI
jgi:hypothetical protein